MTTETTGALIGRKLRDELERQRIPILRAAKRAKLTECGLRALLEGRIASPKIDTLRAICAVIGWTVAKLLKGVPRIDVLADSDVPKAGAPFGNKNGKGRQPRAVVPIEDAGPQSVAPEAVDQGQVLVDVGEL